MTLILKRFSVKYKKNGFWVCSLISAMQLTLQQCICICKDCILKYVFHFYCRVSVFLTIFQLSTCCGLRIVVFKLKSVDMTCSDMIFHTKFFTYMDAHVWSCYGGTQIWLCLLYFKETKLKNSLMCCYYSFR